MYNKWRLNNRKNKLMAVKKRLLKNKIEEHSKSETNKLNKLNWITKHSHYMHKTGSISMLI